MSSKEQNLKLHRMLKERRIKLEEERVNHMVFIKEFNHCPD